MKKKFFVLFFLIASFLSVEAKSDWKASWIVPSGCTSETNSWVVYRKMVNINQVPKTLLAHIAADSKYWLWINGEMVVFEGGLKRGPSLGDTYYDEVEIAPYLKQGENTIALLVWYFGKNGFSHLSSGSAGLLFEAIGDGVEIITDRSWRGFPYKAYQNTDAPYPNYRLSESNIRFDARLEEKGWNQAGYKSKKLKGIAPICDAGSAPFGKLVKRPIPMWKDYGLKSYVSQRTSGDTLFCRLPYNAQVTPYLKVEAPAGKMIKIQTDNYKGGSELNVRAEYITREGVQEYENYGWMNGHEIWYVIPEGVKVLDLKFRETGYDTEFSGSFECNDPFYNELWKRSARTLYITMRDTYMDCPDRERAQWWGDEVNELGEAFYALSPSSHKLALKGIYELMNWQRADGSIFSPMPSGTYRSELPLQMLASVSWYGFYTHYYYSGDNSFIADIYDRMHRYLHEVWQVDEKGQPIIRNGQWSWGDWGTNIDMGVLTSSWYYLALKGEREFAKILGKNADVEMITKMMDQLAETFDAVYWTGAAYRSANYTGETDDRSQAMAVVSGLASADKYPALVKVLKKEYHASPYMEKYVLESLFMMNEPEFALERMKNRYTKMLEYKDYTTLFEGWGIGSEGFGGGTINHAWSGGPLTLLSQKVCGIEPTSPGFRSFKVTPQLGSLKEASASLETHYGMIRVSLKKKGNKAAMILEVPAGTQAEVKVGKNKMKVLSAGTHKMDILLK